MTATMVSARGALAEWLGTGLQNLVRRFDSGRRLVSGRRGGRPPRAHTGSAARSSGHDPIPRAGDAYPGAPDDPSPRGRPPIGGAGGKRRDLLAREAVAAGTGARADRGHPAPLALPFAHVRAGGRAHRGTAPDERGRRDLRAARRSLLLLRRRGRGLAALEGAALSTRHVHRRL